jgi:hypothetical protein
MTAIMRRNDITEVFFEKREDNRYDDSNVTVPANHTRYNHYPGPIHIYSAQGIQGAEGSEFIFRGEIHNILVYDNSEILGKLVNENAKPDMTLYVGNTTKFGPDSSVINFRSVHFDEDLEKLAFNNEIPKDIKEHLLSNLTPGIKS